MAGLALPSPLPAQTAPPDHRTLVPPGGPPAPGYPPLPGYVPPPGDDRQESYYPSPDPYPPAQYDPPPAGAPLPETAPDGTLAESATPPPPHRRYGVGATLATGIESGGGSTSVVSSPLIAASYAAHPQVLLDLALGFAWLIDNQGLGESTVRAGNPQVSGRYTVRLGSWRIDAGLGVTAPLAHQPREESGRLYALVYNRTLAMWGMWNQWQWLPDRMAVPAFVRLGYAFANGVELVAEHADAVMFGVRDASGTDVVGQLAFEALLPTSAMLTLCPRWQTVLLPAAGIDRWQSTLGLRARFATGIGRMFLGFMVNLDEPIAAQPGLDRWGFHLGKEIDL